MNCTCPQTMSSQSHSVECNLRTSLAEAEKGRNEAEERRYEWNKIATGYAAQLADAEKRASRVKAIVDAAVKWRKARWDLPDSQLSGDPNDETVAFALYDTAIRELQKAVSELE